MIYKVLYISLFLMINLGLHAQTPYQVEKLWNIQFKLPQNSIGKANAKKAHYWIETRGQSLHDYELCFYKSQPRQLKQKTESILEEIPDDAINPSQKTEIINDRKWITREQHHIKVQFIEFENKYSAVIFTFEWEKQAYVGWICSRNKSTKELLHMTLSSIQPN